MYDKKHEAHTSTRPVAPSRKVRESFGAAEPEARARSSASFAQFAQQHADEVEKQGGEEQRDAENGDIFNFLLTVMRAWRTHRGSMLHAVERNGAKGLERRAGYSLSLSLSVSAVLSTAWRFSVDCV